MHFVLWGLHQLESSAGTHRLSKGFNALRALGSSSTKHKGNSHAKRIVSMHFVLWGLHQPCVELLVSLPLCVSMHFVLWGLHQPAKIRSLPAWNKVSMHFVLWGLHQPIFIGAILLHQKVSMHFVLWGLHQPFVDDGCKGDCQFQCTSCFGVFINMGVRETATMVLSFNALRALGSSSTRDNSRITGKQGGFNALRALGSSSTRVTGVVVVCRFVSMHFVLWGLHQRKSRYCSVHRERVSMHFVLWGLHQLYTSRRLAMRTQVSMHFVLWGLHQRLPRHVGKIRDRFNALRALGSSSTWKRNSTGKTLMFQCTSCFGVFINLARRLQTVPASMFQCTSCFGVFINWALSRLRCA